MRSVIAGIVRVQLELRGIPLRQRRVPHHDNHNKAYEHVLGQSPSVSILSLVPLFIKQHVVCLSVTCAGLLLQGTHAQHTGGKNRPTLMTRTSPHKQ